MNGPLEPATVAVHAGRGPAVTGSPVNVGVALSAVYRAGGDLHYGRDGSPTWHALEDVLGRLEGGHCVTFGSGIAAIGAVLEEQLPAGAAVVAPFDAYLGLRSWLDDAHRRGRLAAPRLVDVADTEATLAACEGAAMLWVESPTNPLLAVADLPALCTGAHERGARVAVDNTFATPLLQQPLALGADVVVHSVTKLIGGHSDLLLGAAVVRTEGEADALVARRVLTGAIPGALEAFLATRGVRSLPVRLQRAQDNAADLALRLRLHPAVADVRYPGFLDHPQADRVAAQMAGPGTMVGFEVAGGAFAADALLAGLRLVVHATSLGGIETSAERRASQPGEDHVPPAFVRLSVGCEDVEDVWADLDQALRAAASIRAA